MSEHATSAEAASPVMASPVAHPDNATEGDASGATVTTSNGNTVPETEGEQGQAATETSKDDNENKVDLEDETPAATAVETEVKSGIDADAGEVTATPSSTMKSKARRKSSGVSEPKGRKLSKKKSKAKMSHLHVQPGEYYFVKYKGSPKWPSIVPADDMLPEAITTKRPVTAARPDGTYREDYADGGKNALDRTFPVLFLHTNEFAWVVNTDFEPLDVNTITPNDKLSKALYAAYEIASENHDLDYFREILNNFEQQRIEEAEEREASKTKAATKKSKKSKDVVQDEDEDEDVDMADAEEVEDEDKPKPKPSKKRKAVADEDEISTPKRTDSVKKPKLKLINSAQKANGAETPKSAKDKKEKAKPKSKKAANAEPAAPKEPELTPDEKRKIREKEILFLRHQLQKGLLTRDQAPKEEEMKRMSEFITKLEGYSDLEVSIIRVTKINKVLKAILKLDEIPKEAEFKFKERSTELLVKWNKILDSETPVSASAQANGVSKVHTNGEQKVKAEEEPKGAGSDTKGDTAAPEASPAENDVDMEDAKKVDEPQGEETTADDDKTEAVAAEATPVEATA